MVTRVTTTVLLLRWARPCRSRRRRHHARLAKALWQCHRDVHARRAVQVLPRQLPFGAVHAHRRYPCRRRLLLALPVAPSARSAVCQLLLGIFDLLVVDLPDIMMTTVPKCNCGIWCNVSRRRRGGPKPGRLICPAVKGVTAHRDVRRRVHRIVRAATESPTSNSNTVSP